MLRQINSIKFCAAAENHPAANANDKKTENNTRKKVVLGGLAALGAAGLAILLIKKGHKNNSAKQIIKDNLKNKPLSEEEKEKLIKELQAKTDNPDVKAEIRKLIENGDWENLG